MRRRRRNATRRHGRRALFFGNRECGRRGRGGHARWEKGVKRRAGRGQEKVKGKRAPHASHPNVTRCNADLQMARVTTGRASSGSGIASTDERLQTHSFRSLAPAAAAAAAAAAHAPLHHQCHHPFKGTGLRFQIASLLAIPWPRISVL